MCCGENIEGLLRLLDLKKEGSLLSVVELSRNGRYTRFRGGVARDVAEG